MQLTNSRETAGFFVARAIVIAIQYVITPTVLSPLYLQLMRTGGALLMTVATFGVSVAAWFVTLVLFLALRGGFGGVPPMVAGPDRRGAVISSGAEIGAYLVALLIVMLLFWTVNAFITALLYTSLRRSGQTYLIVPVSLAITVATSILFFLIFIALRRGMAGGAAAEDGLYDAGASMGFGRAIATCFRKYGVFSGRAGRPEYWFWALFQFLLIIALAIVDALAFGDSANVFSLIASLILFLPTLAVTVRRLHDADRSGWWVLLWLVPIIGQIWLIVLMCLRGTDGPNRFGMGPADAAIPEVFA